MNELLKTEKLIYISKKKTLSVFVISIAILLEGNLNGKTLPWYTVWIALFNIFIVQFKYEIKKDLSKAFTNIFVLFICPYLVAVLFTICGGISIESFQFTSSRAISLAVQFALILFLAGVMAISLGEECINVLAGAMVLSYMYSLFIAIYGMGVKEIVNYIQNPYLWQNINLQNHGINYLERHDLGAAVGLVIVYQLFFQRGKKNYLQLVSLMLIAYLCFKRIELLGLIVTVVVGIILNRIKNKDIIVNLIFSTIIICCEVYIYLVGSNKILYIANALRLSLKERISLFRSVSGFYELSFFYIGRGFGFTEKYLGSIAGTKYAYRLGNMWMGQMHNDIMRMYIELGAIGSFLWFVYYLKYIPQKLCGFFGKNNKYLYLLMMVYSYISYTMDNTMDYPIFQFTLNTIIVYGCLESRIINDKK